MGSDEVLERNSSTPRPLVCNTASAQPKSDLPVRSGSSHGRETALKLPKHGISSNLDGIVKRLNWLLGERGRYRVSRGPHSPTLNIETRCMSERSFTENPSERAVNLITNM